MKNNPSIKIKISFFFIIFTNTLYPFVLTAQIEDKCRETGQVVWVIDGDTIIVRINAKEEKVRLIGIDTPEFGRKGRKNEYFAKEAFYYAKQHLKWRNVCLKGDPLVLNRDKYGRLLRYIYIEGKLFNAEMIKLGFAEVYRHSNFMYRKTFESLELEARKNHRGIWQIQRTYKRR